MSRKRKKAISELAISQDTPQEAWNRWERMHGGDTKKMSTLDAVQQSTWVYSAISFIAESIMRTTFRVFSGKIRIDNHPIQKLIDTPCEYQDQNTSSKFRYAYMFELLLNGSVMKLFGDMDRFIPRQMSVRPRWHFNVSWKYDDLGRMVPVEWHLMTNGKRFTPGDTIHQGALYNPLHDFEGLAPLTAALISVANDSSINEFGNRFFLNDCSTGVVFTTENPGFTQQKANEAAEVWRQKYAGKKNAFTVKFMGHGLKPHTMQMQLDAKMLQILRSFTKEEIVSGIYKVPLDAISAKDGGGDIVIGGPSGGTQASAREAFLINVAMPWAKRFDEDFNRDVTWRFGSGIEARHDFSDNPILERRRLERAQASVQLIDHGVPLNEVIRWLNLDIQLQPHGDDWWVKNEFLPARVIMDAGKDAIKIAIPDRSTPPTPAGDSAKKSRQEYIAEILEMAETVQIQNLARSNGHIRHVIEGLPKIEAADKILGVNVSRDTRPAH